ncbi:Uncharacterised protein [Mycobacteroides abscessus subsp. abscessus]|nr:Uncharacterised protein [Mycobacteroides abscessus subsp. abscessus]
MERAPRWQSSTKASYSTAGLDKSRTWAPCSASTRPTTGPAITCVMAATLMPDSGREGLVSAGSSGSESPILIISIMGVWARY